MADRSPHARCVPAVLDLHARVARGDQRRDAAFAGVRVLLDHPRHEVVARGLAVPAELLHARVVIAVADGPEDGRDDELVAEALSGLARDRREQLAVADDLAEKPPLLLLRAERG